MLTSETIQYAIDLVKTRRSVKTDIDLVNYITDLELFEGHMGILDNRSVTMSINNGVIYIYSDNQAVTGNTPYGWAVDGIFVGIRDSVVITADFVFLNNVMKLSNEKPLADVCQTLIVLPTSFIHYIKYDIDMSSVKQYNKVELRFDNSVLTVPKGCIGIEINDYLTIPLSISHGARQLLYELLHRAKVPSLFGTADFPELLELMRILHINII